ncbi:MAG: ABC transporter ATP-binding protein [Thermomicrobiales bacterium]|nr:ABC transporter ATP-binding protein [Thermomicrobiales bacterium]
MQHLHAETQTPSLEMRGITKRFGEVVADQGVDFAVMPGEIHALVGENGAGKSTLMRMAAGIYQPDEGEVLVDGVARTFADATEAMRAGIGMVHQHFSLVPSLTVAENLFLAAPPNRWGFLNPKVLNERVVELAARYRLDLPPAGAVGELPVGVQQRLEILKALLTGQKVLILDEPTAVLTPQEADQLLATLAELRADGHSVVLITHKLREVFAVADRITVMRDGRHFPPVAASQTSREEITRRMVGRDIHLQRQEGAPGVVGSEVLSLRDVRCQSAHGREALKGVSLTLHAGEILGIAGVDGNGQDELVDVIAGLREATSGQLQILGREVRNTEAPEERRNLGVAHIPADRMHRGVALDASVADNLVLGVHNRAPVARGPWLNLRAVRQRGEELVRKFQVRTPGVDVPVSSLSGGNIQKVVVARELSGDVRVLLAANPTRGVDVGAAEFIHEQIFEARNAGVAVVLVSSELDEVRLLSDRIMVMENGQFHGPFTPDTSEYTLGL